MKRSLFLLFPDWFGTTGGLKVRTDSICKDRVLLCKGGSIQYSWHQEDVDEVLISMQLPNPLWHKLPLVDVEVAIDGDR